MANEYSNFRGQILGNTYQGESKRISVDKFTGGIGSIDTKHQAIHEGRAFYADFLDEINANTTYYFYGKNTGDKYVHLQLPYFDGRISATGEDATFKLEFVEGATLTGLQEVADIESFNLNRGSSNIATFKIYPQNPASFSLSGGKVFARDYKHSSSVNVVAEWIIPPGGSYVAKFTNLHSEKAEWFLKLFWYELG